MNDAGPLVFIILIALGVGLYFSAAFGDNQYVECSKTCDPYTVISCEAYGEGYIICNSPDGGVLVQKEKSE